MSKESKQLNWFLATMVIGAIAYSSFEVVPEGTVSPPIQIDTSNFPAKESSIMLLLDMATGCDISRAFVEAIDSDDVLTNAEVRELGDLCVARAEEAALKDNPHALDIIRNEYENDGGLRM